jgi:hypothetical protein
MAGIGDGFATGMGIGQNFKRMKEEKADREADRALRKMVIDQRLEKDHAEEVAAGKLRTEKIEADRVAAELERNDPRNVLARREAQNRLDAMDNPAPMSEAEALQNEVSMLELRAKKHKLTAPPSGPTADVKMPLGDTGQATIRGVPAAEIGKYTGGAGGFKSPYASQIAALGEEIAGHEAELAGGDRRMGLFGLGGSREDAMAKAQRKRAGLQAMELRDMVAGGHLSQEEANKRAEAIMGGMKL